MRPRFIQAFNSTPKEIFRINSGRLIRLRAHPGPVKPQGVFDLLTRDGKVHPSILNAQDYDFPNGASMRPNSRRQQHLVRKLDSSSGCVYAVPRGVPIPRDLVLVHEFRDHYSMQAAKEMTVDELNHKITTFLGANGEVFSREEWLQRYPGETEIS
ncbi:hypothetical protein FQN54_002295 [Arachnomyces sp. PD_36]|nr:hypothetical protein FQN54_002295 [Arachnomyces sp. PD_36]